MKCPSCGNENPDNSLFCLTCGKLFREHDVFFEEKSAANRITEIKSRSSITITDSVIIGDSSQKNGDNRTKLKSNMEALEGLELLSKLKSIKREDAAGYQQIRNEAKITEANIEIMKIKAKNANERVKGERIALDIVQSLNKLRSQCVNDNAFAVKDSLEILKEKIKDEESLKHLENVEKMLEALYDDPFRKLEESHQIRVLELCNYIEESYSTNLIQSD
jgi:hypothetical protein